MAIEVMNWVWEHSRSRNGGRLVLLAIADNCNSSDGSGAWPSMAELKRKTLLSERAINTATGALVKLGELRIGLNKGPNGCNRYTVVMTPADSAGVQILRGADSAGVDSPESMQEDGQTPAKSAPPAESAPPQNLRHPPAESAGVTINEPPVEVVVTTSSATGALFETATAATAKTTKVTRKGKARPAVAPRFDEFWKAYPKRKDIGFAEAAWTKAVEAGADIALMIDAARLYAMERKGQDPHWTKLPATWLNKRCWEDEPDLDYSPPAGANNSGYQPWRNPATTSADDYTGPL